MHRTEGGSFSDMMEAEVEELVDSHTEKPSNEDLKTMINVRDWVWRQKNSQEDTTGSSML